MTDRRPPWQTAAAAPVAPLTAAPLASTAPVAPLDAPDTVAEQLALLWRTGGWDARLAPVQAWTRVHGASVPFPDAATWADQPTLGPVDAYLTEPDITDIHLNGVGREVMTRRAGDLVELAMRATWHPAWLSWIVTQLVARGRGRHSAAHLAGTVDMTRPGRKPCVVRYEVALPPLCMHGPALTLRVLRPGAYSLQRLVETQTLSAEAAEFLACCVRANVDVFIVGTAGVGKTTLAQALLGQMTGQRIVAIEDVPELVLPDEHAVHLGLAGAPGHDFADLVRMALRMNAARIVVGETRGREAYAVLAAARNGYPVLTTLHGDTARHGLDNMITMALEASETSAQLDVVHAMINARPAVVVGMARVGGQRRVEEILEVERQFGSARPATETLFARDGDTLIARTHPSSELRTRLARAGALPAIYRLV